MKKTQQNVILENLWEALASLAGQPFYTAKMLMFTYRIKGNEMFVDRKEKSITRATAELAFQKVLALEGKVPGPKKLECFGSSYLYPIFVRLGVIAQGEKTSLEQ